MSVTSAWHDLFTVFVLRGGGGGGKKWHHDGRRTKKINSIYDYISCAKFLIEREIVQDNKLAGWGYSAGGLLVASAINSCPSLLRAAVLEVCQKLWMCYCIYASLKSFFSLIFLMSPKPHPNKDGKTKKKLLLNPLLLFYPLFWCYWKSWLLFFIGSIFGSNKHSPQSNLTSYTCWLWWVWVPRGHYWLSGNPQIFTLR